MKSGTLAHPRRRALHTLSATEAAELLHLHPKRVQSLARSGKLPAFRVGRKWLFPLDALERMLGRSPAPATTSERPPELEISARNRLRGVITAIATDGLMAELRLDVGGQEIVAIITRSSVERMGLEVGGEAYALVKATEVMIGREERRP